MHHAGIPRAQRPPDVVREYPVAPERLIQLLRAALGRRQRLFGLLKIGDEFIGVVHGSEFEIWERQSRALHGRGRIRGRAGGARLEMTIFVTRRTWILVAAFAALYAAIAYELVARDASVLQAGVAVAGAAAIAVIFAFGAARQRAALTGFVTDLYRDEETGPRGR